MRLELAHALGGADICRLDVAVVEADLGMDGRTPRVLFVRLNNSSRAMLDEEVDAYLADR